MDKTSRNYEICPCRHVSRGQVEDIIREKKIYNLKELCEAADVGNKCGGCREELDLLIEKIKAQGEQQ